MSILLLGGSPSLPSSSSRLLLHIGDKLALQGHRHSKLQVRDLPAQALLHADFSDPALKRALALVAEADAVVISTPVYKAAYTGLLKAFLDLLPQDGLAGKLVLPIATGGSQSHMLALDYALRPVLAALSARHVLASIYATPDQLNWDADAGLTLAPPIAARVACGVEDLSAALFALPARRNRVFIDAVAAPAGLAGAPPPSRSLKDHPYTQNSHPG
ncbi:MAG TPA: NADPH-dependent FMN reductase [Janthinobacterium sp.]|jgi:FMN reductase|nr:NADPH-dependent FMN reductase [Janthinobacterium sp.]